jgi:hypothetical protein
VIAALLADRSASDWQARMRWIARGDAVCGCARCARLYMEVPS